MHTQTDNDIYWTVLFDAEDSLKMLHTTCWSIVENTSIYSIVDCSSAPVGQGNTPNFCGWNTICMEETTQPDSTGTPDMVLGKYKEMVLGKQLDIKKKHKSQHISACRAYWWRSHTGRLQHGHKYWWPKCFSMDTQLWTLIASPAAQSM